MTEIIVIAETKDGIISPVTSELVSAAIVLGGNPTVIVPGVNDTAATSGAAISGVSKVIACVGEQFSNYDAAAWASAIDACAPAGVIICAATQNGKDLGSRLAARRAVSVVQDVVAIDGGVLTSPIYSGKAMQNVSLQGDAVVSIRANTFSPSSDGGNAEISVMNQSADLKTAVREMIAKASERLDVAEADIIISGGRGMQDPANFAHLERVADTLGAAVGASRAAVDAWEDISHGMQVGQTGKTVNPSLYIAVGISGAIQHLAGMRTSKYIVAINKDAEAPIFQHADYGIVATWQDALPILESELKALLG
ncbi:MAG TPA: electron transfer flavoprotein subunit alpha/FixB family protein [Candidatus Poseidoniales archaeon]|jgi:electron transfer flavoprotein alpha subunit|nr:MAG: electron transfer flavoprotein subunit alpha [Euryarchaeota archaeon]HIF17033.1 electron transfer flavoprotein subunit alpha/FixB family protein [Candidatus Poseidoniales archaeon]